MGSAVLISTDLLLPVTLIAVVVSVGTLGFRAKKRRGYAPMLLGVAAGCVMVSGRFVFASDALLYCGVGLLVAASIWNAWPKRRQSTEIVELQFSPKMTEPLSEDSPRS
jgi:hypothetical protein